MRILCAIAALCLMTSPVLAHKAPTGWTYDYACCSNMDCKEVSADLFEESASTIKVKHTGEVFERPSWRIKQSKDEFWHRCSVGGKHEARTICIYVPGRGF